MTRPKGARARSRALALQALYQRQLAGTDLEDLLLQFKQSDDFSKVDQDFFDALVRYVAENEQTLEQQLAAHADRDLAQLDPVGRAALLIGLAEIVQRQQPPKVVINEAVELAKTFGPTDCHRFVNAVLDKVMIESS